MEVGCEREGGGVREEMEGKRREGKRRRRREREVGCEIEGG